MSTTNNIHRLGFDEGRIVKYWDCPYSRAISRYMAGNKQLPCDIPGLGVPMKNQPGPITGSLIHLSTLHLKKMDYWPTLKSAVKNQPHPFTLTAYSYNEK